MGNSIPQELAEQVQREVCRHHNFQQLRLGKVLSESQSEFGWVVRVRATDSHNQCHSLVLKVVRQQTAEFRLEVDDIISQAQKCQYLVKIHASRVLTGAKYYGYTLMESCKESLENKRLSESQIWKLLAEISQALEAIHALACIHRDVKPANILIRQDNEGEIYILADLGSTTREKQNMTPGAGQRYFRAPEANLQDYRTPIDIYSLGLTALVLYVGKEVSLLNINETINGLGCSNVLKNLLLRMVDSDPLNRPTATIVRNLAERFHCILEINKQLKWIKGMAVKVQERRNDVSELHSIIITGLENQVTPLTDNMREYSNLSSQFNNTIGYNSDQAEIIISLVERIIRSTEIIQGSLQEYYTLLDPHLEDLQVIQHELQKKVSKKGALLGGTGASIALSGGLTATLVMMPCTTPLFEGAFIVLGFTCPFMAVVVGGAVILAGLGVGLTAIIRSAMTKKDQRLLETVTAIIAGITSLHSLMANLRGLMISVRRQLLLPDSQPTPNDPSIPIGETTIAAINDYTSQINLNFQALKHEKIPEVASDLLLEQIQQEKTPEVPADLLTE